MAYSMPEMNPQFGQIGGQKTALGQQQDKLADPFEQFRQAYEEYGEASRKCGEAKERKDKAWKALAEAGDRANEVIREAMQDPTPAEVVADAPFKSIWGAGGR